MGGEEPREYDREWTIPVGQTARRRVGLTTRQGEVRRFLLQLEYRHDDEWRPIVRYDHDSRGASETTHDVTEEGVHVDVYDDGEKVRSEFVAGPLPAGVALSVAEEHLTNNLERFIQRYESWHQTRDA